jgi:hypothetical protein
MSRSPLHTRWCPAWSAPYRSVSVHTVAVSIDSDAELAGAATRWPRPSRLATTALVLGILAVPLGLLVYPGILFGGLAVLVGAAGLIVTRRGRALGTARAAVGLVAGLVALTIALSLGWQGLRTVRDCQDRVGHRPSHAEIQDCIRAGL